MCDDTNHQVDFIPLLHTHTYILFGQCKFAIFCCHCRGCSCCRGLSLIRCTLNLCTYIYIFNVDGIILQLNSSVFIPFKCVSIPKSPNSFDDATLIPKSYYTRLGFIEYTFFVQARHWWCTEFRVSRSKKPKKQHTHTHISAITCLFADKCLVSHSLFSFRYQF